MWRLCHDASYGPLAATGPAFSDSQIPLLNVSTCYLDLTCQASLSILVQLQSTRYGYISKECSGRLASYIYLLYLITSLAC